MALLFKIAILPNSKFSFGSKCLGTNVGVVKRANCTCTLIEMCKVWDLVSILNMIMSVYGVSIESFLK